MLGALLGPGVWLMARLQYPIKVLLVLLLLSVLWFIPDTASSIRETRSELLGVQYSVELRKLLEHLPRYRVLLFAVEQGDAHLASKAALEAQLLEQTVLDIDRVDRSIGKLLQIQDSWLRFKSQWQALENQLPFLSAPDGYQRYTELIEDLVLLMVEVGDKSGLTLDAELESYYLMLLGVHELPWMLNSLEKIRGMAFLQEGLDISANGFVHIPTLIGAVYDHKSRIVKVQTKVMQGELKTALLQMLPEDPNLISALSNPGAYALEERFDAGNTAVESVFSLYDRVMGKLGRMLDQRLESLIVQRNMGAGFVAVCLLLALYLCAGIYFYRRHDSQELEKATQKIRAGETDLGIELINQEELGNLANSFNQLAATIRSDRLRNKQLEVLSRKDGLTGLPNRRFLDESLNNEWKRAQRSGAKLALLMMDIDFFKSLNDIYGHLHGDECLKKVASALERLARRSSDFVARYGGEEFVLVATDVEKEQACQLAQHIREGIKTLAITHVGNPACEVVTVSIGIAIAVPANTPGPWQQLLNRADLALYQAKEQGRDRFVVDDSLCHLGAGNEGQMT